MGNTGNKVLSTEIATRYIFNEKHFAATKKRVKYPAFMPRNGETSVFRIINLSSKKIWDIGKYVGSLGNRMLQARGDIAANDVFALELDIEPDTQKHPLHANIIGWPAFKGKIKLVAIKLADKAQLHLTPS